MTAPTLFHNGNVLTAEDGRRHATSLLVAGGRVAAVGGDELTGADARLIDLDGQTVTPGFVDPHTHFSFTAIEPDMVDCSTPPASSLAEVLAALEAGAAAAPDGAWVRGSGFHATQIAEGRAPTRAELDEVAPANPLVLVDVSFHACYVNSAALRLAGIDRDSPDPAGGVVERDAGGEPTGVLLERAIELAQEGSWLEYLRRDPERAVELVGRQCERWLALGITAVGDALVLPAAHDLYARAAAAGRLTIGVTEYHGGASFFAAPDPSSAGGAIKLFADASYPTPAIDRRRPDGRVEELGTLHYSPADLERIVGAAAERDLDVAIHCGGGRAVRAALDAFAAVADRASESRFRIEHAFVDDRANAPRYAELGVQLVSQPGLGEAYGALFELWRGDDQPQLVLFPVRSVIDAGGSVASSSDYPCGGGLAPLAIMAAAIERRPPLEAAEAVDPDTALAMCTRAAAHACHREADEGSLAVGKRANFVVLDRDPTGGRGSRALGRGATDLGRRRARL